MQTRQRYKVFGMRLTPSENTVYEYIHQGYSCLQIAEMLHISIGTLYNYRKSIMSKKGKEYLKKQA
ncbi:MAG: hypothetical protein EBX41_01015 [Chitinophagia bacterium]|nr:hypothetical protein [Chitinophagia bacterium]